jgi:hypothetical protein
MSGKVLRPDFVRRRILASISQVTFLDDTREHLWVIPQQLAMGNLVRLSGDACQGIEDVTAKKCGQRDFDGSSARKTLALQLSRNVADC